MFLENMMDELKSKMIKKATEEYEQIVPVGKYKKLEDCFTVIDNRLYFWFNKPKEGFTTGVISESLN